MSKCVTEAAPYLKLLGTCSSKLIKQIIQEADSSLLNALHEVLVNVNEGNVILTQTARSQLRKRKKIFGLLLKNLKTLSSKRQKFKKYGPVIFPIVLPSVIKQLNDGSAYPNEA